MSWNKILLLSTLGIAFGCVDAPKNSNGRDSYNNPRTPSKPSATPEKEPKQILKTHLFRTRGSNQETMESIEKLLAADKFPNNEYRLIPDPQYDNDSTVYAPVKISNECGAMTELSTLEARIQDCEDKNGIAASLWEGKINGNSGEGNWRLVYYKANKKIWMDETTGSLWSPLMDADGTWKQASGFGVSKADYLCSFHNMGLLPEKEVSWHLPTRNEYLQADINGARIVLEDTDKEFWTANSDEQTNNAWSINQKSGVLKSVDKEDKLNIRCVGIHLNLK